MEQEALEILTQEDTDNVPSTSSNFLCDPSTSTDPPESTINKVKHPRKKKEMQKLMKKQHNETLHGLLAENTDVIGIQELAENTRKKRVRRGKKSKNNKMDEKLHNPSEENDDEFDIQGIAENSNIQDKRVCKGKKSKNNKLFEASSNEGKSIQEILELQQGSEVSVNIQDLSDILADLSLKQSSTSIMNNYSVTTHGLSQVGKKKNKPKRNLSLDNPETSQRPNNVLRNQSVGSVNLNRTISSQSSQGTSGTKSEIRKTKLQGKNSTNAKPANSINPLAQRNKENASKRLSKQRTVRTNGESKFAEYMSAEEVTNGLYSGALVVGHIRINPKNANESYVGQKDRSQQDYVIQTLLDRNRALEGDIVVLQVKPNSEWRDNQKSARVVYIKKCVHPRTAVGYLKIQNKNNRYAFFVPRDYRVPRMQIPISECPKDFVKEYESYEEHLFLVRMKEWSNVKYASGTLLRHIGASGDLAVETLAILAENCLDATPFGPEFKKFLPQTTEIPADEMAKREDLRKECIFTIDPSTARDLDDAVSCKQLQNGNFEIGVHISDVTYYLEEGTALDEVVSNKATTIYLVDSVYHMLPVELCLHCSLLPGKDKLSFSVFWEMTPDGDILSHRFSKSVLNSCAQLSYEHAEQMIQEPDRTFAAADDLDRLPSIHNGFSAADLSKAVNRLQKIAVRLRKGRYDNGALQITQPKVLFHLNRETGYPAEMFLYENKDSHRLIEEFMLLANITVARRIRADFQNLAFLRSHFPPAGHMMTELQTMMEELGIHLDITSSGTLYSSLRKYISDDPLGEARMAVLNHLCAKPMTRAVYYCAADALEAEDYHHYALSVDIYTHFTSPIRRYADVMVHRLLNASLEYSDRPDWDPETVAEIAANCNKQKYNAKKAGEQSSDLYLCHFIERNQPFYEEAVVVDVKDHSLDILIMKTGNIVRMYMNNLEELLKIQWKFVKSGSTNKKVWQMQLRFPAIDDIAAFDCTLQIFSKLTVALKRKDKTHKLEAHPIHPMKW